MLCGTWDNNNEKSECYIQIGKKVQLLNSVQILFFVIVKCISTNTMKGHLQLIQVRCQGWQSTALENKLLLSLEVQARLVP